MIKEGGFNLSSNGSLNNKKYEYKKYYIKGTSNKFK